MHELAVTKSILNIVLDHAKKNRASRVISLTITSGALCDFTEEWLQYYFTQLSKGTCAEDAVIKVINEETRFLCRNCDRQFEADLQAETIQCPECKSTEVLLQPGKDFYVKEMEVI